MEFKEFKNLINSEGDILSLVESIDTDGNTDERLYLKAICLSGKATIYCKVNQIALEMFFQGRIAVKELFLLRADEEFIIDYDGSQDSVICDDMFIKIVIDSIECGNNHFYSLPKDMRVSSPFDEILYLINRDYLNGLVSIPAYKTSGSRWLRDHSLL